MDEKEQRDEIERLEQAIVALEAQRALLGEEVVEAALAPMRERLAALRAERANEQRKMVTVLFADLAGFTAMSESMDPEDVREVVDAYFKRWVQSIGFYGGEIEKFIGDAVLAVFGIATAREDDAERAIRAALDTRAALAELNEALAAERDLRLNMRVGIHTGRVLVSVLDERRDQDFVVVGDSVNLASRLQSNAPLGGILISHDTYRHVQGIFDVQALAPIQVKGKREPIAVYLVGGARPRAFRMATRGVEGVETRMLGRDAELAQLQEAFEAAVQAGERRFVTIMGEAGLGKSRLLYAFDSWLEALPEAARIFRGRADPSTQVIAYALLRNLFALRFDVQENDSSAVVRQKLEAGIAEGFAGARAALSGEERMRAAHFIGHFVGFDLGASAYLDDIRQNPQGFQERALQYLEAFCRAQLGSRPVVLLLEDLHWADHSSLDALGWLAQRLSGEPLLVAATARPELLERRPRWGEEQVFHTRLAIRALPEAESRALIDEISQRMGQLPDSLRELVVKQAEGNPFFMEELIKMLIEEGWVAGEGTPRPQARAAVGETRIPQTLTGVLQARFDSLQPEEQETLQRAAVVGRVFWDEAVRRLSDDRSVEAALDELWRREMILRREQSAFGSTQEYLFKHALLRDVTYSTILKRLRRRYHAGVARWLEEMAGQRERRDEYAALIAEHYERAEEPERAATWHWRAGRQAAARYANAEALYALGRALALLPEGDAERRFEILLARETVYGLQGDQERRLADIETLGALAEASGDEGRQARAALRQAAYAYAVSDFPAAIEASRRAGELARGVQAMDLAAEGVLLEADGLLRQGEFERSREYAEQARALASEHGWLQVEGKSLRHLGLIDYYLGNPQAALEAFKQALDIFVEAGDRQGEGQALNNVGGALFNLGNYAEAGEYYARSLQLCRQIGELMGQGRALNNLGIVSVAQADYQRAEEYYLQALEILRAIGHRTFEGSALDNLGNLALYKYEYQQAQEYHRESLRVARQIGDRVGESYTLVNLGHSCLCLGMYEDGHRYLRESLELNRTFGDSQGENHARVNLSRGHLAAGDLQEAERQARLALTLAEEREWPSEEGWALHVLGEALLAQGRLAEAAAQLQAAAALRRELDELKEETESRAALAAVHLELNELEAMQVQLAEVLSSIETHGLQGFSQPVRLLLRCYDALKAREDSRAGEVLEKGYDLLEACVSRIEDEALRRSFLEAVPDHRRLLAAWRAQVGHK